MTTLPPAEHLDFEGPAPGLRPYAHHYRFGDRAPRPAVVYIGGTVGADVYEARRSSAPTLIAEAFARALDGRDASVDLVICPCPLATMLPGTDEGRRPGLDDAEEWIASHFDDIVLRLGARPTSLGCVGYSAGAAYAALLAAAEDARAAAMFGPAGVDRALAHVHSIFAARHTEQGSRFDIAWLVNGGDPVAAVDAPWQHRFPAVQFHRRSAAGGHPFADYDANGFVTDAFAFVLERL